MIKGRFLAHDVGLLLKIPKNSQWRVAPITASQSLIRHVCSFVLGRICCVIRKSLGLNIISWKIAKKWSNCTWIFTTNIIIEIYYQWGAHWYEMLLPGCALKCSQLQRILQHIATATCWKNTNLQPAFQYTNLQPAFCSLL